MVLPLATWVLFFSLTSYDSDTLSSPKRHGFASPTEAQGFLEQSTVNSAKNNAGFSVDSGLTTGFDGLTLRIREAGNVDRGNYHDYNEDGNRSYCWPALFTDIDPNIICERN